MYGGWPKSIEVVIWSIYLKFSKPSEIQDTYTLSQIGWKKPKIFCRFVDIHTVS